MSKFLNRRGILQTAFAAAALLTGALAQAQDAFPSKPLKVIVPLPAGGAADASIRFIANAMQASYGYPIVIENKPGGASQIAMNAVTSSPADGYTLLHVYMGLLPTQAVFKRFDMFKQLQPVAGIGETDVAITVSGKTQFKTVKELIDYGRANPGKLTYASPGAGSGEHLALVTFCKNYGIDAVHIPLKGGPDVAKALIMGEADFGTLVIPFLLQFAPDGKVRPLALLSDKRNVAFPALPTYKEEKLEVPRMTLWGGLAAPAGTPPAVMAHLEKLVMAAVKSPEVQKSFMGIGLVPQAITGADFAKMWRDDYVWIAKAAGEVKIEMTAN